MLSYKRLKPSIYKYTTYITLPDFVRISPGGLILSLYPIIVRFLPYKMYRTTNFAWKFLQLILE